jgi:hypothetical protein
MAERSTSFGSAGTLRPPLCDPDWRQHQKDPTPAPNGEGGYQFKEEMKAEPKESSPLLSSPLLSSPEKTPEGEPSSPQ